MIYVVIVFGKWKYWVIRIFGSKVIYLFRVIVLDKWILKWVVMRFFVIRCFDGFFIFSICLM